MADRPDRPSIETIVAGGLSAMVLVVGWLINFVSGAAILVASAISLVIAGGTLLLGRQYMSVVISNVREENRDLLARVLDLLSRDQATADDENVQLVSQAHVDSIEHIATEVWVYGPELIWEIESDDFLDTIAANCMRGVPYRYLLQDDERTFQRLAIFRKKLETRLAEGGSKPQAIEKSLAQVTIKFGAAEWFAGVCIAIYNPWTGEHRGDTVVVLSPQTSGHSATARSVRVVGDAVVPFEESYQRAWSSASVNVQSLQAFHRARTQK